MSFKNLFRKAKREAMKEATDSSINRERFVKGLPQSEKGDKFLVIKSSKKDLFIVNKLKEQEQQKNEKVN